MTERIDIVVTEKGSRVVKRNIEGIGDGAVKSSKGVDLLKTALKTLGVAALTREMVRLLDTYTNLQNRLRATGLEGNRLTAVYRELYAVSNSTRSSLEGSVELYSRLAISSKELGVSQRQLIDFTKSLNQAIILSGASAQEAQAGLLQLSQGMASGTLRGDELRSVLEQLPAVADVIAKELGVTRGELRALGEQGKISAVNILEAFKNAREELNERFGKTLPTISQSFQVLRNKITFLVGEFDKASGASALLSKGLLFIAENLEVIAKVAISAASGLVLIVTASTAISLTTKAVRALTVAIASNPLGFLLVALTSAITALTLFRNEINLGIDDITTLGDLISAFGESVSGTFRSIYESAQATLGPVFLLIDDLLGDIEFSVVGALTLVAKGVDSYVGLWVGAIKAVMMLFRGLPAAMGDFFTQALNLILRKIGDFVNAAGKLLSTVTEFVGLGEIATIDIQLPNLNEGAASQLGKDVGTAFKAGFDSVNFAQDYLKGLTDRAQQIGRDRVAAERAAQSNKIDLGGIGGGPKLKLNADESKKLEQLISSYDKVYAAQQEYAKGLILLEKAEASGAISGERKQEVISLMSEQLKDALDPLSAVNRELEREAVLLGLTANQREVAIQLLTIEEDLRSQGVLLTAEEVKQLETKLKLLQEEARIAQARDQILAATLTKQQEFISQLEAVNQLLAEGLITRREADAYLVNSTGGLLEGTVEAQSALIAQYEDTYRRIDELRQADLISEQTAQQLKTRADASLYSDRLTNTKTFFSSLSALSRSENKKLAAIGQAAAVTTATIDGVLAVQKALASAPPPVNYALAAAVGAAAAANVAQILSQTPGFAFGGDFEVGGVGGTDSQMVAFRATPGEKVSITTPAQERSRKTENGAEGQPTAGNSVKIVNVLDSSVFREYLDSADSDDVFLNKLQRNGSAVAQIVETNS